MAAERAEPFQVALAALRDRLRDGAFLPGERIAASELAETLGLSATPVREALSQLSGEGLLEDRRGQGWFLTALTGLDIADLYRTSLTVLLTAQDPHRVISAPQLSDDRPAVETPTGDAVQYVERLFADWTAQAGGGALYAVHRNLQARLAPVRRAEPLVFTDLPEEAARLQALAPPSPAGLRLAEVRRFYARRIAVAPRLSGLIYPSRRPSSV
jgi:DNA-binding transcriptional ArsR family regulator